ncbi:exosome complex exonuclease rrp45 [Atractiella rhizophila]|nr:exosome complex exonuclease rrp45 [Atractiella rhizophila]KAH8915281.1 exosome complex exonuclease rrp45 [Atractiella rhizophila]
MPKEVEPSLIETEFVLGGLKEGKRLGKRGLHEFRDVHITFAEQLGWVKCCLGDTVAVAQVSASVVKPSADRPFEGFLILTSELNAPSEEEIQISRSLEKAIRRSGAVDRESLCIVAGQKVWQLRVDIHFLNDDGNLVDCACIAAITALKHFRKPDVSVEGEEVTIYTEDERVLVPIAIHHIPLCISFAFFPNTDSFVLDPTHLETQLSTGSLILTLNAQREVCVLNKAGGTPLEMREIFKAIDIAARKVKELDAVIKEALEKDKQERIVEVY